MSFLIAFHGRDFVYLQTVKYFFKKTLHICKVHIGIQGIFLKPINSI